MMTLNVANRKLNELKTKFAPAKIALVFVDDTGIYVDDTGETLADLDRLAEKLVILPMKNTEGE